MGCCCVPLLGIYCQAFLFISMELVNHIRQDQIRVLQFCQHGKLKLMPFKICCYCGVTKKPLLGFIQGAVATVTRNRYHQYCIISALYARRNYGMLMRAFFSWCCCTWLPKNYYNFLLFLLLCCQENVPPTIIFVNFSFVITQKLLLRPRKRGCFGITEEVALIFLQCVVTMESLSNRYQVLFRVLLLC